MEFENVLEVVRCIYWYKISIDVVEKIYFCFFMGFK